MNSMIQIAPISGPPEYVVNDESVSVLMPFRPELTEVYEATTRPALEEIGLTKSKM